MPVQRIPNTARRTESSPLPVPSTVDLPSPSSGPVDLLVGTDSVRGDSRTVPIRRVGGTETASPLAYLPVPFPTAPVHPMPPPAPAPSPAPRCLACGHRSATGYPECEPKVLWTVWTPCTECYGRRVGRDGTECRVCCGVGFFEHGGADDTLAERAGEPGYDWPEYHRSEAVAR